MTRARPQLPAPPEQARAVTTADGERLERIRRAKPLTAEVTHEFRHRVRYNKDGSKYRIRLKDKRDRQKWSEMKRPWVKLERERGQHNNALEPKRMFKKPNGQKAYVFESMVEGIERRTGLRANRKRGRVSQQDVYSREPGLIIKSSYENIPGKGLVLAEKVWWNRDTGVEVRRWKRKP